MGRSTLVKQIPLLITVEILLRVIQILQSSMHRAVTTTMTSSAVNAKDWVGRCVTYEYYLLILPKWHMKSLNACQSSSIRKIGVFIRYFSIFSFLQKCSVLFVGFRERSFKLKWQTPPFQLRKKEMTIFSWYKTLLKLYKHGNHITLEWLTKMNAAWKLLKAYLKIPYLLCRTLPWNFCQLSTGRHGQTFLENGEYHGTSQYV